VQEDKKNKVLPIGGPGKALTARDQAMLLFNAAGVKPNFFPVRAPALCAVLCCATLCCAMLC